MAVSRPIVKDSLLCMNNKHQQGREKDDQSYQTAFCTYPYAHMSQRMVYQRVHTALCSTAFLTRGAQGAWVIIMQ